ncbi:MAG: hypothetical protein DMF73_14935, partial [Acidobacteria bacterium]
METLLRDIRYGVRSLLKRPGFTAIAVITLALGIGANTAIFSVVNGVLLRPLPYVEAERLIVPWGTRVDMQARTNVSYPDLVDWQAQTKTLEYIAAYNSAGALLREGDAEAELISGAAVSADLFQLLKVAPVLGHPFTRTDDQPNAPRVIVLGYELWRGRFNSDPNIIGRQIRLGSSSASVLGVLPEGFRFPAQATKTEFLMPLASTLGDRTQRRNSYSLRVVARLKPGVTAVTAVSEMRAIGTQLEQQYPDEGFRLGARFISLHEAVTWGSRTPLLVLLGAVGFVLLIACANVANLLLARAATRHKEMAIRVALGAGRRRVVRQLLTESLLLSLFGGVLGLLVAWWGLHFLLAESSLNIPRLKDVGLDTTVLAFTAVVSVLTGVIFGLAPAVQASRADLQDSLKEGGRSTWDVVPSRVRALLVVVEVALSLVLLVGAGLLGKSFLLLSEVRPGFEPEHVLSTDLSLSRVKYPQPEQQQAGFAEIVRRAAAIPGVEAAAVIYPLPLGGDSNSGTFLIAGRPAVRPEDKPTSSHRAISPDYFRALNIPLSRGRPFDEHDTQQAPPVLIVNETFARRYFAGTDVLGQRIIIEGERGDNSVPPPREIVGIVGDVRHQSLDTESGPEYYVPYTQAPQAFMSLVVRSSADNPGSLATSIRQIIKQVDKDQYVAAIEPMTKLVAESVARRRFNMMLTGLFAGVALLLASVGIFGVLNYMVAQRTQEIGLRVALGAQARDILRLVLGQGLRMIL